LPDRTDGTSRGVTILQGKEPMQPLNVAQSSGRPNDVRHESRVRSRQFGIFSRFEARKPAVRFFCGNMQSCRLIFSPRRESVLPQTVSALLALDILFDRLAHEPIRRTATRFGKSLQASLDVCVEL
jgi:hypothetical protein